MTHVADYYRSNRPARHILEFLDKRFGKGKTPDVNDLSAVDSFHLRGRAATEFLSASVVLKPGVSVLDMGSGPGGTARYLANRFGVTVTGLDLTFDFTRLATLLSGKVRLAGSTHFTCASALDMPLASSSFHGVWMEHVQMNIPGKARLVREIPVSGLKKERPPPPAPSQSVSDVRLLMGDQAASKVRNLIAAVMDKRLSVIEAVCLKPHIPA